MPARWTECRVRPIVVSTFLRRTRRGGLLFTTIRLESTIAFDSGSYAGRLPVAVSSCNSLFSPSSKSTWANPPGCVRKIDSQPRPKQCFFTNFDDRNCGIGEPVLETQNLGQPESGESGSYSGNNELGGSDYPAGSEIPDVRGKSFENILSCLHFRIRRTFYPIYPCRKWGYILIRAEIPPCHACRLLNENFVFYFEQTQPGSYTQVET